MGFISDSFPAFNPFIDTKYHSIDDMDDEKPTRAQRSNHRSSVLSFAAGLTTAAILIILTLGAAQMLKPRSRTFQEIEDDEWNHCGRSSQHAMDRGCVMEPLFYGWMPSKCVFPELTDQFPVFEDRTWYQDENLTQVIAPEDLYRGKHNIIWTEK